MKLKIENIQYDYQNGLITKDGKQTKLTNLQKKLLNYLIDNPSTIVSKQTIMEIVWKRIITENSINQVIVVLRNHLEIDSSKPKIIVTHFGKGISFEGSINADLPEEPVLSIKKNTRNNFIYLIVPFIVLLSIWGYISLTPHPVDHTPKIIKDQKILVLPMAFIGGDISKIEQRGMKNLIKSSFLKLDSEGQMIFDETSLTTKQAIEKHWRLEKNLIVISSEVKKVGNIYHSLVELSSGLNTLKRHKLSANNINDLLNNQIDIISGFEKEFSNPNHNHIIKKSPNQTYIDALGYKDIGDLAKAKTLITEMLKTHDDYYQARFTLAEILFLQKQYDKSRSQLETLKSTSAYLSIGTEIELKLAEIKLINNDFQGIVDDLKAYQLNHPNISEIKKSKIKIIMAQCYLGLGDLKSALHFYRNSIINLNEQLNPLLYAQSYFGRGQIGLNQSNSTEVYALFEKSLDYARLSGNIHHQVIALNEMAGMLFSSYDWDKGIAIQKQAINLMELETNQMATAKGLGRLAAVLNQRGHFTDAKLVNEKLGKIADELDSSLLRLHYLHYESIIAMNTFEWDHAQQLIMQHLKIATHSKNYAMLLNNAFLEFEWRLVKKDLNGFEEEWNERVALIKEIGFERFLTYMDLYLARYYKQINLDDQAITLLQGLTEKAQSANDIKFIVDAQNQLAMIYLKSDAKKALAILNNLEQHNPHPNPYLDLKAQALYKLGKNIEALTLLNQAKLVYHESWTAENQSLYDTITNTLK